MRTPNEIAQHIHRKRHQNDTKICNTCWADTAWFDTLNSDERHHVRAIAYGFQNQRTGESRLMCCYSAAALLGLPVFSHPQIIEWAAPCSRSWKNIRTWRLPTERRQAAIAPAAYDHAILCTSIPATCIDIARLHNLLDGLVAADFALENKLITHDELHAEAELARRLDGAERARTLVNLATPGCQSPMESWLKYQLYIHQLPAPIIQAEILDHSNVRVGFVDALLDQKSVGIEYDGSIKYENFYKPLEETLRAERQREKDLQNADLRLFRLTKETVHKGRWVSDLCGMLDDARPFPPERIRSGYRPVFQYPCPQLTRSRR